MSMSMKKENIRQVLVNEGFKHIFEWEDAPNTTYEEHTHQDRVTMFILNGGVTFIFENGEIKSLQTGDRYNVTPQRKHTAIVGPGGCSYMVGEMIEGDS